ncbi:MAG: hypothetical protein HFG70_12445 [Hungatella sp.]|jgi:hypothetical protein|nr:hypothetical protein [Hungatella sp.]
MELIKNKKVGKVLLIVEGGKHEFSLMKKIFVDVLGYTQIEQRRGNTKYYMRPGERHSVIAVINTKTSNISSINEEDYLERIFGELLINYDFDIDDAAIYYLFDRDPESNVNPDLIKSLIAMLTNSRDNENYMRGGMLILSYPSIEAYEISNFLDNSSKIEKKLGSEVKAYINENAKIISMNKINENSIIHGVTELITYLKELGMGMDLDKFSSVNKEVFNDEEQYLETNNRFKLLSMFSFVLADLGILREA